MTEDKTIIVFYDSPCIDGAASAYAVKNHFADQEGVNVEFVPLGFGIPEARKQKVLDNLRDGVEVIFVDTSPKDITLESLINPSEDEPKITNLTVIDHHLSEVERLAIFRKDHGKGKKGAPKITFIIDADQPSAASLTWDTYNEEPAPKLFSWIGKMEPPDDLRSENELAIAAYIDSLDIYSSPEEAFKSIEILLSTDEETMLELGRPIHADNTRRANKLLDKATFAELELMPGVKEWVPVINGDVQDYGRGIDRALTRLACSGATCGVVGVWFEQKDATIKLSLRTAGFPDAGQIAKHLATTIGSGPRAGGGHPSAAVAMFDDMDQFGNNVKKLSREDMIIAKFPATEKSQEVKGKWSGDAVKETAAKKTAKKQSPPPEKD